MNLEEVSRPLPLTTWGSPGLYEPGSIAPPPPPWGGSGTAALCVESGARECGRARTHSRLPRIRAGRTPQNSPPAQCAEQKGKAPLEKAVPSPYSRIPECSL